MTYYKNNNFGKLGHFFFKDKECSIPHRESGPALEYKNGEKHWIVNGKHHREDGPSSEYPDGSKIWAIHGILHREDGPAIEYADGRVQYFLNNKLYKEDEYWKEITKIRFGGFV